MGDCKGEGSRGGELEEEWRRFRETILEVREEVCGKRRIIYEKFDGREVTSRE